MMGLSKHTPVVNIYIEQKASLEELHIFKATIDKRLENNSYPFVGSKNPDGLSQIVIQNIINKNHLHAVKQHKDEKGLDLKTAKDQVDDFRRLNNI